VPALAQQRVDLALQQSSTMSTVFFRLSTGFITEIIGKLHVNVQ